MDINSDDQYEELSFAEGDALKAIHLKFDEMVDKSGCFKWAATRKLLEAYFKSAIFNNIPLLVAYLEAHNKRLAYEEACKG